MHVHWIVLDLHQADVLWQLDRLWREQRGTRSAFCEAARDIEGYGLDPSLSRWAVQMGSIAALKAMRDTLDPLLGPELRQSAALALDELEAVAETAAVRVADALDSIREHLREPG